MIIALTSMSPGGDDGPSREPAPLVNLSTQQQASSPSPPEARSVRTTRPSPTGETLTSYLHRISASEVAPAQHQPSEDRLVYGVAPRVEAIVCLLGHGLRGLLPIDLATEAARPLVNVVARQPEVERGGRMLKGLR